MGGGGGRWGGGGEERGGRLYSHESWNSFHGQILTLLQRSATGGRGERHGAAELVLFFLKFDEQLFLGGGGRRGGKNRGRWEFRKR